LIWAIAAQVSEPGAQLEDVDQMRGDGQVSNRAGVGDVHVHRRPLLAASS
jgi:hypothetical protein